jgi:peptidoglycan/LPS O-acetylase OafA/YrhL
LKPDGNRPLSALHTPELDGVRGLAILMVVLFHVFRPKLDGTPWQFLMLPAKLGWAGVDLFFVLSGFLIAGILLDNRHAGNYYQVFYARRSLRILPLYSFWLLGFFILWGVLHPLPGTPRYDNFGMILSPVSYLTFSQNIAVAVSGNVGAQWMGPTWSLAVEEQFYLLLPLIVRYASRDSLWRGALGAIVLAPFFRYLAFYTMTAVAPYFLLPCRMDALAWGVLLALVTRDGARGATGKWLRIFGPVAAVVCFAVIAGYLWQGELPGHWNAIVMPSVTALLSAVFLAWLILTGSGNREWLRSGVLPKLGTVTFGLYMVHQGINHLFHDLLLGALPGASTPVALLVTGLAGTTSILLAIASWRWFEKPITDWGRHRFRYSHETPRILVAA